MGKMSKIIKYIFAIIGVFSTIIGCVEGINFLCNKEYKKENEITIYNYDSQGLVKKNISNKVKIYYQDNIVKNLYYKSFTIKNTGRKEIKPSDYVENLCIEENNNSILDAQLISYSNSYIQKNIIEKTIIDENKICFPNILLNSNDYFQINVITKDFPKSNKVTGLISGINKINVDNSNTKKYKLNLGKKIFAIFSMIFVPFIIVIIFQILIGLILYKNRVKKFMKLFKCDKQISEIFSTYYFKKRKYIKRNSTNIDKDIKLLNKEIKKYINDKKNKSDED